MGIHDAFTTNADFSSISNDRDENLFLSGIYQKTIFEKRNELQINENGTMPSDVRRPNLRPLKRMLWQGGHIKFIADHPFWFAIVKQNLFLFIGSFTG
ncbi:unnamed protein product [Anisakis simplex]|uniref:SERPIN domain-containing protein n=1 Tax=Anisakis simplex TaxID=6269 RepID=A0A0M3KF37_ANISI|nr:unnamed protein product [Anisakis simplex]